MKLFKKALFTALSFLLITVSVQAQGKVAPPSEEAQQQRFEKLAAELELTEDQKVEFQEINKEYKTKRQELWEKNKDGDRSQMRPEMMKLREEQSVAIKGILTTEQYEKFRSIEQEQRKRMRKRRGQGQGKGKAKDVVPNPDNNEEGN